MFWLGDERVVGCERCALHAPDVFKTHLPGKVWIFAEVFFDASPAGIARKVEHGTEEHADSGRACLCRDDFGSLPRQLRIPCGCEIDLRGENGSGVEAVNPSSANSTGMPRRECCMTQV